jgi:hypothetical protein
VVASPTNNYSDVQLKALDRDFRINDTESCERCVLDFKNTGTNPSTNDVFNFKIPIKVTRDKAESDILEWCAPIRTENIDPHQGTPQIFSRDYVSPLYLFKIGSKSKDGVTDRTNVSRAIFQEQYCHRARVRDIRALDHPRTFRSKWHNRKNYGIQGRLH